MSEDTCSLLVHYLTVRRGAAVTPASLYNQTLIRMHKARNWERYNSLIQDKPAETDKHASEMHSSLPRSCFWTIILYQCQVLNKDYKIVVTEMLALTRVFVSVCLCVPSQSFCNVYNTLSLTSLSLTTQY